MISWTRRISSPNSSSPTWKLTSCSNCPPAVTDSFRAQLYSVMFMASSFLQQLRSVHRHRALVGVVQRQRRFGLRVPGAMVPAMLGANMVLFAQLESADQALQVEGEIGEVAASLCRLLRAHGRLL